MKKQSFLYLIAMGYLASHTQYTLSQNEFEISEEDETEVNSSFIEVQPAYDAQESLEREALARTNANALDCITTVQLLTSPDSPFPIQIQNILQQNIYLKTNPIIIRSLHDMPSLQPLRTNSKHCSVYMRPFGFFTQKAIYTNNSPYLKSYLDLLENVLIKFIPADENISGIAKTLGQIKLENRRIGAMIDFDTTWHNWSLMLAVPLYYNELNLQLTNAEKSALEKLAADAGIIDLTDPSDIDDYLDQHVVRDQFGLGDIRIRSDYQWDIKDKHHIILGAQITIPSAVAFVSRIIGNKIQKCTIPPVIDLETTLENAINVNTLPPSYEKAKSQIDLETSLYNLGTAFLDRLSDNLANPHLGQKQVSIGAYLTQIYATSEHTKIALFAEADYFFKGAEKRMFKIIKTSEEFNRDWESQDETVACQNLAFLNQQTQNTLYPPFIHAHIRQGVVAKASATFTYTYRIGECSLGYDFWWRQKEKVFLPCLGLNRADGTRSSAYQNKIFGALLFKGDIHCNCGWRTGLRGEYAFKSHGIGNDFGIVIDIALDF